MLALRAVVAVVVGFASALIAFAAFYVHGDLGAVFAYLGARGDVRRLGEAGVAGAELEAAQAQARALADAAAHPDFAVQMIPLCLLIGAGLGYLAWQFFGTREGRAGEADVQERMLMRLAYRSGGRFGLREVLQGSPLGETEARATIARLEGAGKLRAVGDDWEVA